MSSEEKLHSIRERIDLLTQWLKEQEAKDKEDDSFMVFSSSPEDTPNDAAGKKASWSDVVAAAKPDDAASNADAVSPDTNTPNADLEAVSLDSAPEDATEADDSAEEREAS